MLIKERLSGEKIILRNISENDGNITYLSWLNDYAVNRYLETRWSEQTLEGIRAYISAMISSPKDILLAIEVRESGKHVGNIKLGGIDYNNSNANIGYFVGEKDCWGTGIATEAVSLISDYAFNVLNLHRIYAGIIEGHNASRRVLEKNGFELEGNMRDACKFENRFVSHIYYGKVVE